MGAHNLTFPASHSYMWIKCAGQPQLSARVDFKEPKKTSTLEGVVGHWVAANYLRGIPVTVTIKDDIEITEEMHDGGRFYLEHIKSVLSNCSSGNQLISSTNVEYSVFVNWLMPSVYRQIADYRHYDPVTATLYIWDYKYGFDPVDVIENTQMIYYALDAATKDVVQNVIVFIVQPRAFSADGPVRSWRFDRDTLNKWAGIFKNAYVLAHREDAPLVAGDHCKRCKARGSCPALYEEVIKLATVLDAPPSLTPLEVGERLKLMDLLHTRSGDARSALHAQGTHYVQNGQTLPGWKLIPKTTQRKLTDEKKLVAMFTMCGGNPKELYSESLKPITQLEKLLPKNIVNDCTTKPAGALVLVPDTHQAEGFENKVAATFNTPPVKPTGAI